MTVMIVLSIVVRVTDMAQNTNHNSNNNGGDGVASNALFTIFGLCD